MGWGQPCSATCLRGVGRWLTLPASSLPRSPPETPESPFLLHVLHLAALLFTVSLGFCPPQPYQEPEPSVAEPPSCPLALDMSLRNSSYSVTPGPCVVAQLPSEDMSRLAGPQSRDHGFLRTKMKVLTLTVSLRLRGKWVHVGPAHEAWPK